MNTYAPHPIETNVELSPDLLKLTEALAENTHDVWAEQRIRTGWTYGQVRNDEMLQHPCLVPYSELSEAEKEYDRRTAVESIKLIVALGWTITPPEDK